MKSYGDTTGNNPIRKSGSTQPYRTGEDRNPGQGSGTVPNITGQSTPTIVKTGATNNGGDTLPRRDDQR